MKDAYGTNLDSNGASLGSPTGGGGSDSSNDGFGGSTSGGGGLTQGGGGGGNNLTASNLLKGGYGQYPGLPSVPGAPPGVSAADNYKGAVDHWSSGVPIAREVTLITWTGPYQEMDYKNTVDPKYERFGNYNFGAVAAGLGIPKEEARRGAGYVQRNHSAVGSSGSGVSPSLTGVMSGDVSITTPALPGLPSMSINIINGGVGNYEDFGVDQDMIGLGYDRAVQGLLR